MKSNKKIKKLKAQIRNLNYDLGYQVGEQIVRNFLYSLSTEGIQANNVIEVPKEESDEYKRLYNVWKSADKGETSSQAFDESRRYHHELEQKYLPQIIEAQVNKVNPTKMNVFKGGIKDAIWDCDFSNYGLHEEWFVQTSEYGWCTIIRLKLDEKNLPKNLGMLK